MRWLLLQLEMSAIRRGRALIGLRCMVHVALQNAEVSILYGEEWIKMGAVFSGWI